MGRLTPQLTSVAVKAPNPKNHPLSVTHSRKTKGFHLKDTLQIACFIARKSVLKSVVIVVVVSLVNMFRKYVSDGEDREAKHLLSLYSDIDAYQHTEKEKGKNTSKDKQAVAIYK